MPGKNRKKIKKVSEKFDIFDKKVDFSSILLQFLTIQRLPLSGKGKNDPPTPLVSKWVAVIPLRGEAPPPPGES